MSKSYYPPVSANALAGSMRDYRVPGGKDLLERVGAFYKWQDMRRQAGVWPFSRSTVAGPRSTAIAQDDRGKVMRGVNFASQDYLSLSAHPAIKDVALETVERYGVHSAGSVREGLPDARTAVQYSHGRQTRVEARDRDKTGASQQDVG